MDSKRRRLVRILFERKLANEHVISESGEGGGATSVQLGAYYRL